MRDYVLFFLGRALAADGECEEAGEVFQELIANYPESRWYLEAKGRLDSSGDCLSPPTAPLLKEGTQCDERVAVEEKADCLFKGRRYPEAKVIYRGLKTSLFNLVRLSQSASRTQDFETALWANEEILKRYPVGREAREAQMKIVSLRMESGDYRGAIAILKGLMGRARSSRKRRFYWERLGWCHFRLEDYPQAIDAFSRGIDLDETPFLLYWKGRSLERLGRSEEAGKIFQDLTETDGGSYYGIRALERLSHHGVAARAGPHSWWPERIPRLRWRKEKESFESSPDLERIYELNSLGLFQDARIEIRRAQARLKMRLPEDPKEMKKGRGKFTFEIGYPEKENPNFPVPYADTVLGEVARLSVKIDPLLLYAMMKQESRFREEVTSPTGAVGLLQVMPDTGRLIARETGWEEYDPVWLFDPVTNIELAARYAGKLFSLFDGRWYAVAAAYNAGEEVVRNWLGTRKGLPEEEFIEEIPYRETRDYVKSVFSYYKAYRWIYQRFD